jgi:hypothetical protein
MLYTNFYTDFARFVAVRGERLQTTKSPKTL